MLAITDGASIDVTERLERLLKHSRNAYVSIETVRNAVSLTNREWTAQKLTKFVKNEFKVEEVSHRLDKQTKRRCFKHLAFA